MVFLLLFSICSLLNAQAADSSKIFISDFDTFIRLLEETHPDPYSVLGGRMEFNRKVQNYREEIAKAKNNEQFYFLLNRFLSSLKDGHTSVNNPQGQNTSNTLYLQVKLKTAADGIYISETSPGFEKHKGSLLKAVNNISVDTLLKKTIDIKASENIYGGYYNLISFLERSNYAGLLFPGNNGELTLTLQAPDKSINNAVVSYAAKRNYAPAKSQVKINEPNGLLYWDMIGEEKNIGYFAWNSTVSRELGEQILRDSPQNLENNLRWIYQSLPEIKRSANNEEAVKMIPSLYEQFYTLLKEMKEKKSEYLIIDLRSNSGGMTPLVPPLMYMLYGDKYLDYNFNLEYNRRLSPLFLNKIGMKSIDEYNKKYNTDYRAGDFQFGFMARSLKDLPPQEKRSLKNITYAGFGAEYVENLNGKPIYSPSVIVLVSPTTFSAAYQFMCMLQMAGNAVTAGVPSRQAGNTFMETTPFELPGTHFTGAISNAVQIFFPGNSEKGNILMPDFTMKWEDFGRYGFDENSEILYVLSLIKNGQIK